MTLMFLGAGTPAAPLPWRRSVRTRSRQTRCRRAPAPPHHRRTFRCQSCESHRGLRGRLRKASSGKRFNTTLASCHEQMAGSFMWNDDDLPDRRGTHAIFKPWKQKEKTGRGVSFFHTPLPGRRSFPSTEDKRRTSVGNWSASPHSTSSVSYCASISS
eukprot:COSAG06_NODE_20880_length_778_cov_0.637703_1_plen_157_part_10